MTITLELSSEQEQRLQAEALRQNATAVREILMQAVDATVSGLLRTLVKRPNSKLPALLDQIAALGADSPALSTEAASRAGIYAEHP